MTATATEAKAEEQAGPQIIDLTEKGDTCDRCGPTVAAAATLMLPSGLTLSFCGHHAQPFGYEYPLPENRLQGAS